MRVGFGSEHKKRPLVIKCAARHPCQLMREMLCVVEHETRMDDRLRRNSTRTSMVHTTISADPIVDRSRGEPANLYV